MPIKPNSIRISGGFKPLKKVSRDEMLSFVAESCLDRLMHGTPFREIISDAMHYGIFWQQEQKK